MLVCAENPFVKFGGVDGASRERLARPGGAVDRLETRSDEVLASLCLRFGAAAARR